MKNNIIFLIFVVLFLVLVSCSRTTTLKNGTFRNATLIQGGLQVTDYTGMITEDSIIFTCVIKNTIKDDIIIYKKYIDKFITVNSREIYDKGSAGLPALPYGNFKHYSLSKQRKIIRSNCTIIIDSNDILRIQPDELVNFYWGRKRSDFVNKLSKDSLNISALITGGEYLKNICPALWTGNLRVDSLWIYKNK